MIISCENNASVSKRSLFSLRKVYTFYLWVKFNLDDFVQKQVDWEVKGFMWSELWINTSQLENSKAMNTDSGLVYFSGDSGCAYQSNLYYYHYS